MIIFQVIAWTRLRTMTMDSQTQKSYIYTRFQGNSEKKSKKMADILIIGGKLI